MRGLCGAYIDAMKGGAVAFKTILFEKTNGTGCITLNRPDKSNAMNRDMIVEIGDALEKIERDDAIRALIITGNGRTFCAGMDLGFVGEELVSLGDQQAFFRFTTRTVIQAIENLGKPVIAAVNGFALAGGFELMLACDLVVAAEDALIGDQHINYGLVGPGGSTQKTPRMVGLKKAKELILLGEKISASEAERIGLINRVVPAKELLPTAQDLASRLAQKSPVALKIAKTLLNRSMDMDLATGSELEVMSAIVNAASEDYQEGLRAFKEKRKPVFKGR